MTRADLCHIVGVAGVVRSNKVLFETGVDRHSLALKVGWP